MTSPLGVQYEIQARPTPEAIAKFERCRPNRKLTSSSRRYRRPGRRSRLYLRLVVTVALLQRPLIRLNQHHVLPPLPLPPLLKRRQPSWERQPSRARPPTLPARSRERQPLRERGPGRTARSRERRPALAEFRPQGTPVRPSKRSPKNRCRPPNTGNGAAIRPRMKIIRSAPVIDTLRRLTVLLRAWRSKLPQTKRCPR